jgi:hypothetical protein
VTVRHAMEDPGFAAIFDQQRSITARWPVKVEKGGKTLTL